MSSYMEALSILFMEIGRSAPRYQELALLYPQSKTLQSDLQEYFIVVVGLCTHIYKFTEQSAFRRATSALNSANLRSFQNDLDRWARCIKEEVTVLEVHMNSSFRNAVGKLSESLINQQRILAKLRVLDLCSKYDYEVIWKQTRKSGNTTISTHFLEYKEWKVSPVPYTCLLTGKLGSGKSVLLANIVDDLNTSQIDKKTAVAYFFCRYNDIDSLKTRTIIGSLARQLLCTVPNLDTVFKRIEGLASAPGLDQICDLLYHGFPPGCNTYFILDGLDECEPLERESTCHWLQEVQKKLGIKILVSFRVEPNKEPDLPVKPLVVTSKISMPEDNPDIKAFVGAELERCIENRKLVIGDPTLIVDILDALLAGSQGMFLWVVLQIQTLCCMETDEDIRNALATLPRTLSETFSRILATSRKSGRYQAKVLDLTIAACRPLSIEELREALGVVPGDPVWTPAKMVNDVHSALACCGCLLVVDEDEATIRFVHHSVQQYLLDETPDGRRRTIEAAQRTMADIIVTYLNYGTFGTELSTTRVNPVVLKSAPSKVIRSVAGPSSMVQNLALKLLRSKKQPEFDISMTLAEVRKTFQSNAEQGFRFYSYATKHWLNHVFYASGQDKMVYRLASKLITERAAEVPLSQQPWVPLIWAAENGNEVMFKSWVVSVIKTDKDVFKLLDIIEYVPLPALPRLLILDRSLENHFKSIPYKEFVPYEERIKSPDSVLTETKINDIAVIKAIINHPIAISWVFPTNKITDINARGYRGRTALSWAVANHDNEIVKMLLNSSMIDVNAKDTPSDNAPLHYAAAFGYDDMVKLLLDNNASVNVLNHHSITPLSYAVQSCSLWAIARLLDNKAIDVNIPDENGWAPVHYAVQQNQGLILEHLLDTGLVNFALVTPDGQTPLDLAKILGLKHIARLLEDAEKTQLRASRKRIVTYPGEEG